MHKSRARPQLGRSTPELFWGLCSNFEYKKWELNFTLRANSRSYTYSVIDEEFDLPRYNHGFANVSSDYFNTVHAYDINKNSVYYLHKSSFVHLENISLTYNVENLFFKNIDAKFFVAGQNLKTWTDYKGLNPDTQDGIDYNNYPRPRTITLGVELNF